MKKITLSISGMTCSACSNAIDKHLSKQKGIEDSLTNLVLACTTVTYNDEIIGIEDIEKYISESGYKSLGLYKEYDNTKLLNNKKRILLAFLPLVLLMAYLSFANMLKLPVPSIFNTSNHPKIFAITLFIISCIFIGYGLNIIINGLKNILRKKPNMDSLVTIGITSSFIYSTINLFQVLNGNYNLVHNLYFDSVVMIIYLVKIGRYIDSISKEKTKDAIKDLVQITPLTALIKEDYKEKEITINEVKENMVLICKPGMKIAVDGIITKGITHTDESFLNGESLPVKKNVGDEVVAGSINIDGFIEYKATRIGPKSTISEIVRLVTEASNTKPNIARLVDKISSYFVPGIFMVALITLIIHLIMGHTLDKSLLSFVNVLVISCPCSLGLATPLAIVVSLGTCAKQGILIRNSKVLETANKIDTIVFDKTGTLTEGKLQVTECISYSNYSKDDLINIVANLERKSNHPIALAFKNYITKDIKVLSYKEFPGIGFKGGIGKSSFYVGNDKIFKELHLDKGKDQEIDEKELLEKGNSIIYVFENKQLVGLIGIRDAIKKESKKLIKKLKEMNIDAFILSGDNKVIASRIGKELEIENVIGGILPKEKTSLVKQYIKEGRQVMMVGDGINDAPSLKTANVGVSVYGGTDIAANSSDIILLKDNLLKILDLINISKKTLHIIKTNLFWSFFYNIIMIPIATGFLPWKINPVFAALSMMISSLIVVLNSLRLKRIKENDK